MILLLLLAAPEPDFAAEEHAAMQAKVAGERVRARYLRREEGSILDALREIDDAIAGGREELRVLGRAQLRVEAEIARVDRELEATRARLGALREQLGARAASMRRLRQTPLSDLIASAPRTDLRRVGDALRRVMRHDASLVASTRAASLEVEQLGAKLRERRAEQAAREAEIERGIEETDARRADRAALLQALRKERSLSERLAREIAAAARKLEREGGVVHGLLPPPPRLPGGFVRQKGRLPWPVVGRVEVPFGKQVGRGAGMVLVHRGLDLRAPFGVPVLSVFAGRVAYAAPIEGLGGVVILDHGQRWCSVYANLGSLSVDEGASVTAGEELGLLGDEGSDKGAYLYFELRSGGIAVDPMPWLAP